MTATPARANTSGSICPLCTWAQDNDYPHPCITTPNILLVLAQLPAGIPETVAIQLRAHPAQPLIDAAFRPVHRTWCFCQCSPTPSTAAPGKARS